jgi:glutathione S-transferase
MPKAGVGTGVVAANACVRSDHAWIAVVGSSLPLTAAGIADAVGSRSVASNDTLSAISLTKSEQSLATRRSRLEPVAAWLRGSRPGSLVLEKHMQGRQYVVSNDVTVCDFVLAYTLDWGNEVGLLGDCPQLIAYMERMYQRPKAAPRIAAAMAALSGAA